MYKRNMKQQILVRWPGAACRTDPTDSRTI